MKTSNEVQDIFGALIQARREIVPVARTKSAGRYRYATLDNVIDMLSIVLPKYSLGFVQSLGGVEGQTTLNTRIIHQSGQWIEDELALPQTKLAGGANEAQELGAAITYFKRYALSAFFGIATDDDTDGVAEASARKQLVKATAKEVAKTNEEQEGSVDYSETIQSTGDKAADQEIKKIIRTKYRDQFLFSQKTIEWLNKEIATKPPFAALESAKKAARKRINDINADIDASV